MKTLKIIAIIIIVIVLLGFLTTWWLGLYTNVAVIDKQSGSYILVGEQFVGDYAKVGETMMNVDKKLKAAGINCHKGFGIYYDNPKVTPREKCRSFLGDVLEDRYFPRIEEIKSLGLKVDTVRQKQALIAEFPMRSRLSYFIGPMKVYPVMQKFADQNHYKYSLAMELYDVPLKKIFYIMQYEK